MAYQLLPTRPEDQERVIEDLTCSRPDHAAMAHERARGRFPKTRAVDDDRGHCLVAMPAEPRQEHAGICYCFCYRGALYRVRLHSMFYADVSYEPMGGPAAGDTQALRDELTKAFATHHMLGLEQGGIRLIPVVKD